MPFPDDGLFTIESALQTQCVDEEAIWIIFVSIFCFSWAVNFFFSSGFLGARFRLF